MQAFLASLGVTDSGCGRPRPSYSPLRLAPYQLERRTSRRSMSPSGSHTFIASEMVSEYRPIVHRRHAFARALGPTNPPRITRAAEPSGFRWWGFAPHFSVTHSDIRTRCASTAGFRCRFTPAATLPYPAPLAWCCRSFGSRLCPVGLSAPWHSTSELLRTLSRVAASKPTSWLSKHRDILCHSAGIWGP